MSYPASVHVVSPDEIQRWRPLVQWFLAIPHAVVLSVLGVVSNVVALFSWFAIVFTGRLPEAMADVQAMILRYLLRYEAYAGFLHDQYPPFTFDLVSNDPGGTPVSASYSPALEGRNRLTVAFRFILVIPALLFMMVMGLVAMVCWFLAFFAVIVTGRWPSSLRYWVITALNVLNRTYAYALLLTDQYPPFSTE